MPKFGDFFAVKCSDKSPPSFTAISHNIGLEFNVLCQLFVIGK